MPGFDFYVSGIEDGIIQALKQKLGAPDGYLKEIAAYGGELNEKTLQAFVAQLAPRFPLALVAYGEGDDELKPAISPAFGEPRIVRHSCSFAVFCCSNDARGEKSQRAGVYKMLTDVRDVLSGLQFRRDDDHGASILLTLDPLTPSEVRYLARLPQLTAYGQYFETFFNLTELDRRKAGVPVADLIVDVMPLGGLGQPPEGRPGVILE